MECQNCELKQRQFFCENCLKQHLLSLRLQTQHATSDRDAHIASSQTSLTNTVNPARLRRADLRGLEERVQEIWDGVNQLRSTNDRRRERVQKLRGSLSTRRRTLAIATSSILNTSNYSGSSTSISPHAPASVSPQTGRPISQRTSPSISSHSPTPPPSSVSPSSRPLSSASRPLGANFFPSTSHRTPLTVATTPPHSYSRPSPYSHSTPHVRIISSGSAPYGTPIPRSGDPITRQIEDLQVQMASLGETMTHARVGLVQELVEVFSVVEVGGRPPLGGRAGTKGEWTIGGLVLPVPGDIRRYPPDHMNAVLTHTIHFVTLLAFYLGIKLPFEVVWSRSQSAPSSPSKGSGLLGVGIPWIGAIRGGETGGWARWSNKYPLHVSSSPPIVSSSSPHGGSSSSSSSSNSRPLTQRSSTTPSVGSSPLSAPDVSYRSSSLTESSIADAPPSSASSPGSAFTTALAMLVYDVCYLAHTQGVEVPLAHAGDVLGNLWAVCCSPELGRRAHAARPLLPPPTSAGFPLDFSQLLQATAATPARVRAHGASGRGQAVRSERIVEEDEGWDLLDADADLIE